ncbi:cell division protein FtsQ [Enhygromyxa salina]|uniref:Cell division protein FtsQ n=1 Tax=Enhygromyxa salina TaxID=215803 RepID=A0A2S9YI82_9BACT|nr:FtsQ-type POTRA domain-containing protein [Enhygromyxa salina]PRQ04771.1 cell division protein FtsQ [Enhygromyxa salina]
MTAPIRAQARRKQQASPRRRSAPSRGRPAKARRGRPQNSRRTVAEPRAGVGSSDPSARPSKIDRIRQLFARREAASTAKTSPDRHEPPQWPRRLGLAALKLGTTVVVAWGLLIAGREVYEYATTSARFEVQHFIYEPSQHLDDDQLRELLAIEPGTNILACELTELSERVAAHPWVALATVTRNLPDTLEIEVIEHEPEAIVLAGRFYLVNAEGQPFKAVERGERGELPIITGIERSTLAEARDDAVAELVTALDIIHLYQAKQRPRLGEVNLGDDGSVTLYTAEAGTQLRLGRDDFEARLVRWDALRAALGDRSDRLAVVHLDHESRPDRRDRVVARFANERDEAVLLAQAANERTGADDTQAPGSRATGSEPAPERLPARRAGKRQRIPSYE